MKKQRPGKLFCSRFSRTKKEAERVAAKMRSVGGVGVVITGQRGCWRVRGEVEVSRFARFCADEASRRRNSSELSDPFQVVFRFGGIRSD